MFENLVESTKSRETGKKLFYFLVTSVVWSIALAALIVAGIYRYNSRLDDEYKLLTRIAPLPPLALAAPPPPSAPSGHVSPKPQQPVKQRLALVAPQQVPIVMSVREAPKQIEMPKQAEQPVVLPGSGRGGSALAAGGVEGGIEGGVEGGTLGGKLGGSVNGVLGGTEKAALPPPPPPPKVEEEKPEPTPSIVKRSEGVIRGNAISKPVPAYPAIARNSHIEGDVKVAITIGEEGEVISVNIISGPPLLREAALEAARGWKFKPTLVNKTPVKVEGVITFRFSLQS